MSMELFPALHCSPILPSIYRDSSMHRCVANPSYIPYWEHPFILRTSFHLENILSSWEHPFLLRTSFPLENILTSWKPSLRTSFPSGNILPSWEHPSLLRTSFPPENILPSLQHPSLLRTSTTAVCIGKRLQGCRLACGNLLRKNQLHPSIISAVWKLLQRVAAKVSR